MRDRFTIISGQKFQEEKRVLPRFPFSCLTFKPTHSTLYDEKLRVYEVKDISYSGMQLRLPYGQHPFSNGDLIEGNIHGLGSEITIQGRVVWSEADRMGIAFTSDKDQSLKFGASLKNFLSTPNIVASMRPLHRSNVGLDLPQNLKFWLQADGPMEIFVWQHSYGSLSRFQILRLQDFVEWEDGQGLKTGKSVSHRQIETPLCPENEILLALDPQVDHKKLEEAFELVAHIPEEFMEKKALDFLKAKLTK